MKLPEWLPPPSWQKRRNPTLYRLRAGRTLSTVLLSRCGALPWSRRVSEGQASGQGRATRGLATRHDQGKTPSSTEFSPVDPWVCTPRALAPRHLRDSEEKT